MTLNNAQNSFKKNTLDGEVAPRTITDLKPVGQLSLQEAFEVYHQGYVNRLTGVLADTYQTVKWVLGENLFKSICYHYIESQPSVSFKLSDYGATFPEYLSETVKTRGIPFLQDLASFEWQYKEVAEAATPDPMPTELAHEGLLADNFKVSFIDAMEVVQSMYAVQELWQRRKEPPYMYEDINWGSPQSLLIYKKDRKVLVQPIDPVEAEIIIELKQGKNISEALMGFSDLMTPERTTQFFQTMMKAGIIDDIILI